MINGMKNRQHVIIKKLKDKKAYKKYIINRFF